MNDFGTININLASLIEKSGLSKNKICQRAEIQYNQLSKMINNQALRIDLDVLARLCYALDCDISDLLTYKKP